MKRNESSSKRIAFVSLAATCAAAVACSNVEDRAAPWASGRHAPAPAVGGGSGTQLPHALGGGTSTSNLAPGGTPKTQYPLGLKPRTKPLTPAAKGEIQAAKLPTSVDLSQGAPSAGNQGQTGSCATWATGYSAMGWWDARTGLGGAPYAPMYLYAQVVQGACSQGTDIAGDLDIIKQQGVDTQADYEPMQQQLDCYTQPSSQNMSVASRYRIVDYVEDDASNAQEAIERELAAGRPVILGLQVYENFENANAQQYLVGAPQGQALGGHGITAFKYDANGVWILNSWGTQWGLNGWAELSWEYIAATTQEIAAITGVVGKGQPPPADDGGVPTDDGGAPNPPPPPPPPPPPGPGGGGPTLQFLAPADGSAVAPGDPLQIVVAVSDAAAYVTDVQLVWTSPSGSSAQEMEDWGNGQAGLDLSLDPAAQPGSRTVTIIATDSNGQTSQISETLQVQ